MGNKSNKLDKNYTAWEVYLKLLKCSSPYWMFFVIGVFGTFLASGTEAAFVWSIKPFMDSWSIAKQHEQWWFNWLPLIIIMVLIIRGVANFLSHYFLTCVGRNVVSDFRKKIFAHLMHLPACYYDKESSGALLSILTYNTEQVAHASTTTVLTVLEQGSALIFFLIVMFKLSWQLTLAFIITAPIVSIIVRYSSKRLRYLAGNVQKSMGELTHVAEEGIENYKVIRLFGGEEYEKTKFAEAAGRNRQREMKVVVTDSLGSSLTQIITALPIAIIVFVATSHTSITLGGFGAFLVATLSMLSPLKRLTRVNNEIQKGVANAAGIFNLLDEKNEEDLGVHTITKSVGKIEYRNINFCYPGAKKNVLHAINFTIEPGQNIALVGKSGGGKTTLVNLLPRFYDVLNGEILLDDINIQDYKLSSLRQQISVVSQHLTLFNDTIARNIAYGSLQEVSEEEITKVAEAAYILDFIHGLPEGINTMIGENGLLLSGGQRQRIAIARALLKNAPILILDEATSSLDTESERHIQTALEVLMKGRTTLIIAHRLSTIERADKIMVLDGGRIVEVGNHLELLGLNGVYAKLHKMQFRDNV